MRRADLDRRRTRRIGRSELLFGTRDLAEQLRAGFLPLERTADFSVSKYECQPGHEVQMRRVVGLMIVNSVCTGLPSRAP